MSLIESIFQFWGFSWLSRTISIATQGAKSIWPIRVVFQTTKWRDLAARSQVGGYWELVGGTDENLSKSVAVVWHSSTNIIRVQRTKNSILAVKKLLQLNVCLFQFS